ASAIIHFSSVSLICLSLPATPVPSFVIISPFVGRWYETAVVSTCPHYMLRRQANPVVVALELKNVTSEGNFTMTASTFRNGSCKETSTVYSLTNTPGRFFHLVTSIADVDSFVVHTNYNEYAMILQLSTEKPSGNKTTIVKLYILPVGHVRKTSKGWQTTCTWALALSVMVQTS
uniref:Lipocalin/cytosolic fatty-acid binding domain-containing protein n=1 Tax=Kryptolebias marmoratus TaxID=37003 RepID=A0A3Q3FT62_KRYMA